MSLKRSTSSVKGVSVFLRTYSDGRQTWVARYRDPDTRRVIQTSLSALGLVTKEARTSWAKRVSDQLSLRNLSERREDDWVFVTEKEP